MLAINYTEFRNKMKKNLDSVVEDYEPLLITRKENKNVVVISEETYNNLLENLHLRSSKENYEWLLESKKQIEEGKVIVKTLEELEAMANE